jgi:hypothetical protein
VQVAIRPARDTHQYLNVSGRSTQLGTPVLVYSWSGGQSNEVWSFVPADF